MSNAPRDDLPTSEATGDRGGGRHRAPRRAGRRSRLTVATLVVAALCAPAAAAVVVLGLHDSAEAATRSARGGALAAAKTAAHDLLSYDYRSLRRDVARAEDETTGAFRKQYADTAKQLLTDAGRLHAIVQASVGSAGVVDGDGGQVVVLLFVDQASVKQVPGQRRPVTRIDQSRVRLTMTRVGDRWLVSDLSAL